MSADVTASGVRYHTWCRENREVILEINGSRLLPMPREDGGIHTAFDTQGRAGDTYKFRLECGESFPDPEARSQAGTVHEASLVVDPTTFNWNDGAWKRPAFRDLVIYEMHVGTFTQEGTFRAAITKLPHLRALGVNALEIMPVADFPGARNWGYDGVLIYAPARVYGSPDDLRALVDAAHASGIAVILDVVYNHLGPSGNYLARFSRDFFTDRHYTPWGQAFNFDGANSRSVRDFFVRNPIYWMEEFHIDGFRFDATHAILDDSKPHIFEEFTETIHALGGYAIAEDSENEARMLRAVSDGGYGFDAVWADDFHHTVRVSQTAEKSSYFQDFHGTTEEVVETLQHGWFYRGQQSARRKRKRGTECDRLPPQQFVHCISNHDQAGNRAFGERLSATVSPAGYRALSAMICLTPFTPMLFMGQEWDASTPFQFFTDHEPELGALITAGRRKEFADFPEFSDERALEKIPDPQAEETFLRSKLDWSELSSEPHAQMFALYRECLAQRRERGLFRPPARDGWRVELAEFGVGIILFEGQEANHLLLFDLSGGHRGALKTRGGERWELLLSSNEIRFGGDGRASFDLDTQHCEFSEPEVLLLRATDLKS